MHLLTLFYDILDLTDSLHFYEFHLVPLGSVRMIKLVVKLASVKAMMIELECLCGSAMFL